VINLFPIGPLATLGAWAFWCGGDEGYEGCYTDNIAIPIVGAVPTTLYVWAAVYGFKNTKACRDVKSGSAHRSDSSFARP
jgi:hypothetical protein